MDRAEGCQRRSHLPSTMLGKRCCHRWRRPPLRTKALHSPLHSSQCWNLCLRRFECHQETPSNPNRWSGWHKFLRRCHSEARTKSPNLRTELLEWTATNLALGSPRVQGRRFGRSKRGGSHPQGWFPPIAAPQRPHIGCPRRWERGCRGPSVACH